MADRQMRAGGSLIALGTIAGTISGGLLGQPSAGLIAGAAAGAVGAVLVWAADRRGGKLRQLDERGEASAGAAPSRSRGRSPR